MDKYENLSWGIVAFFFSLLVMVIEPFIIVKLWLWFVVPFGLRAIGWAEALGLNILINLFIFRYEGQKSNKEWAEGVAATMIFGLDMLLLGFLVHYFLM